jgi:hemerythrin-like domain-containing protein
VLAHEHEIIQLVAKGLAAVAGELKAGRPVDPPLLRQAVDFMRQFADACHHAKEEEILFPAMERRGLPSAGGPTTVMRAEHAHARKLVASLADAVERYGLARDTARADVAAAIDSICEFYANHIWKEDNVLFPMTDRLFTAKDIQALRARFDEVEAAMGEDVHDRWARFAQTFASAVRPSAVQGCCTHAAE